MYQYFYTKEELDKRRNVYETFKYYKEKDKEYENFVKESPCSEIYKEMEETSEEYGFGLIKPALRDKLENCLYNFKQNMNKFLKN